MVIVMGEAFPLRDENGEEIVPEGSSGPGRGGAFSGKTRKSAVTNRRSDAGSQFLPDVIEEEMAVGEEAAGAGGGGAAAAAEAAESPTMDDAATAGAGGWSRGASANRSSQHRVSGSTTPAASRKRRKEEEEDFISVVMKCHEGVRSNVPFDVHPKQLVIAGHSSLFVQVSFTLQFKT